MNYTVVYKSDNAAKGSVVPFDAASQLHANVQHETDSLSLAPAGRIQADSRREKNKGRKSERRAPVCREWNSPACTEKKKIAENLFAG